MTNSAEILQNVKLKETFKILHVNEYKCFIFDIYMYVYCGSNK